VIEKFVLVMITVGITIGIAEIVVAEKPPQPSEITVKVEPQASEVVAEETEAWRALTAELKVLAAQQPRIGPVVREWLTVDEAAEYSGLPSVAVEDLIRQQKVNFIGRGPKTWRIQRSDLVGVISTYNFGKAAKP
jgi:excisionase family DNA binding protein